MNLFISHKEYNWANLKKTSAEFLNGKNLNKVIEGNNKKNYYTSLEDLGIKIGHWHQILDHVDSIILVDLDLTFPSKIKDENLQLYINFFLTLKTKYFEKTKNFSWVNELPGIFSKTNATRKNEQPCIWAAGCSFTAGTAVNENERFVNIISDKLKLDLVLLATPGSTVINQCDQILRSNIRKNDLVILGITNYARIDHAEGFNWKSTTISDMSFDNFKWKYWTLDYFESYTHSYACIKNIQQVVNFCQKVGAKLILVNLLDHSWSSLIFHELPYYLDLTRNLDKNGAVLFKDLGTDEKHPGPKQHKEYANKILNLIEENNYGKTI